jgi:hypothetical protein
MTFALQTLRKRNATYLKSCEQWRTEGGLGVEPPKFRSFDKSRSSVVSGLVLHHTHTHTHAHAHMWGGYKVPLCFLLLVLVLEPFILSGVSRSGVSRSQTAPVHYNVLSQT